MNYTVTLPYTKIEIPPRGSFPAKTLYSPLVKTFLFYENKKPIFSFDSVIDSGADFCVFPAEFGEMIGLTVEAGQHLPSFGVGGKDTLFFHKIKVGIIMRNEIEKDEIWKFECTAGFSRTMNKKGVGLLGREGFFDLFKEVSFNQNARMFRLKGQGLRPREEGHVLFEE